MAPNDRRGTVLRLVASVLVLGGAYIGLCAWTSRHVPPDASVGATRIGGMSPAAAAAVERQAATLLATPVVVAVPGTDRTIQVEPGKAGFSVDTEASLDGLTGFSLDPRIVWEKLTGSEQRPLLTRVDDHRLTGYLEQMARSVQVPVVEGSVGFEDGDVRVTLPRAGRVLDIAETKLALRRAFPDAATATAVLKDLEPKVSADRIRSTAEGFAREAVSAPIVLVADGRRAALQPERFATAISFTPDGAGGLKPQYDEAKLADVIAETVKVRTKPARNAHWAFAPGNGRPRIVPSTDGSAVDEQAVTQQVIAAMTSDARTVTIKPTVTRPSFTTSDADRAGVEELVVDFRSPFPPRDTTRTHNLVVATRTIDGTYVPAGGTFSLNGVLGERTTAKGYADGTVIVDGRLTRGTGGGISQVSTTIYNMAYFAGADIIEATPHAFFIPRYPEGREATVFWPTVDNKWRNDTPHGMLLQTWVEDGYVHGRIWSSKTWDVKSVKGPRRDVVPPKTVRDDALKCYPQRPNPGFDVTVTRQWYRPGSSTLVRSEDVHTHYIPENRIICTNPDAKP
ncbi:MAG: VanW family protein [Intrasporangium sp.]|uniref:VanW family protein n=1 Tax=Intrasporangium sp. TaxID=1925024 RepID=UPI00264881F6|nr:VanW family protein [Intrasporangium sp.]MDN5794305.1 VanW family protein [Intrasporangium sp.]